MRRAVKWLFGAVAALALCLAVDCAGTETGNPPLRMALSADLSTVASGVTVDTVYVTVGEVRFSNGVDCGTDGPVLRAPRFENLVPPSGISIALPDGAPTAYCRVRLEIARAEPPLDPGVPAELSDHDVLVAGRRADGRRFRVLSRMDREVDVQAVSSSFAGATGTRSVVLSMDVGKWLTGLALDTALVGADGVATIDELTSPTDVATFDTNISASFSLYADDDGNGELDATERAAGVIAHD